MGVPDTATAARDALAYEDITTTEIYLHVAMGANGLGVASPLDSLAPAVLAAVPSE